MEGGGVVVLQRVDQLRPRHGGACCNFVIFLSPDLADPIIVSAVFLCAGQPLSQNSHEAPFKAVQVLGGHFHPLHLSLLLRQQSWRSAVERVEVSSSTNPSCVPTGLFPHTHFEICKPSPNCLLKVCRASHPDCNGVNRLHFRQVSALVLWPVGEVWSCR